MVNPAVVLSVSLVVISACIALFVFMRKEGLTPDDVPLLDACMMAQEQDPLSMIVRSDDAGDDVSLCDDIVEQNLTWDSVIPCAPNADRGFTFRGLFWAYSDDQDALAAGTGDGIENIKALAEEACAGLADRRQLGLFDFLKDIGGHVVTAITPDDNTYWPGSAYGPCSMNIGFVAGLSDDDAECSGLHGFSGGKPGCRKEYARGANDKLFVGCHNHDYCLVGDRAKQGSWCGAECTDCISYDWGIKTSFDGWNCDDGLVTAAESCMRGGCNQGYMGSLVTYVAMKYVQPQKGWCGVIFPSGYEV
jgi:hypothetical protein